MLRHEKDVGSSISIVSALMIGWMRKSMTIGIARSEEYFICIIKIYNLMYIKILYQLKHDIPSVFRELNKYQ
jgi:hypothetical protein